MPSYLPKRIEKTAGCCASYRAELNPCQPWFLVMDSSGYKIDIPESFAPDDNRTVVGKCVTTGVALTTLVVGIVETPSLAFFFAYFTQVSLILTIIYLLLSFCCTVLSSRIKQPKEKVTGLPLWTWIAFVTGVHAQFMASLLFWITVYQPGQTQMKFYTVASHGIVMFLALIDGLVLNRIPLRLMHWWGFIFPVQTAYLIWTVIHWKLQIGNPNEMDDNPETNDDAIYSVLAWGEDEWKKSLVLSILVMFVLGPLVYLYMWCASRYVYVFCTSKSRLYFLDHNNHTAAYRRKHAHIHDHEAGGNYHLWRGK